MRAPFELRLNGFVRQKTMGFVRFSGTAHATRVGSSHAPRILPSVGGPRERSNEEKNRLRSRREIDAPWPHVAFTYANPGSMVIIRQLTAWANWFATVWHSGFRQLARN